MRNKNISIPDDIYEKLREERRTDESFGEAIDRPLSRRQLSEFWGAWDDDTADRDRAGSKRAESETTSDCTTDGLSRYVIPDRCSRRWGRGAEILTEDLRVISGERPEGNSPAHSQYDRLHTIR